MNIGNFEIKALETGTFKLDGGAMFGTVPKPLWEKAIPPDELNRIPMALRIVLLRDLKNGRNLLIDTGIGEKWSEKMTGVYAIDHSKNDLLSSLKNAGLEPNDITDVVLTHLHFDHTGGSTTRLSDGSFAATFPKARYYIQKDNYEWATAPNSREAASYIPENFRPLMDKGILKICNGERDFETQLGWTGFSVRMSYGHTIGLQCPLINIDGQKFFYPSDLIPTASHLPIPWVMGYDIHVIKVLEEKETILAEAVRDKWIFVYEHDPKIPASLVKKGLKHYECGDIVSL